MQADLIRHTQHDIDIKIVNGAGRMHVLQWRRRFLYDEVLLDGKTQATSYGVWGREKVYGLVFRRDEEGSGGDQVMLIVDARTDHSDWFASHHSLSGVRLDTADGPLLVYGTLDPKTHEKPATFSDWMRKHMGMEW